MSAAVPSGEIGGTGRAQALRRSGRARTTVV